MSVHLIDLASVIRSKNSGPFEITLDIIFKTKRAYEEVKASNAITPRTISRLYAVEKAAVRVLTFDPASAIKIVFPRRIVSGGIGDTDIYGAQQHAPLLTLKIEGASRVEP